LADARRSWPSRSTAGAYEAAHVDPPKIFLNGKLALIAEASAHGDTVRIGVNYHFHNVRQVAPLK